MDPANTGVIETDKMIPQADFTSSELEATNAKPDRCSKCNAPGDISSQVNHKGFVKESEEKTTALMACGAVKKEMYVQSDRHDSI